MTMTQLYDTDHIGTQHNDTLNIDTQQNDAQHTDTQYFYIMYQKICIMIKHT